MVFELRACNTVVVAVAVVVVVVFCVFNLEFCKGGRDVQGGGGGW